MKIDMSSSAIARRLKTVESLRRACISLAGSSSGLRAKLYDPERVDQALRISLKIPTPVPQDPDAVPDAAGHLEDGQRHRSAYVEPSNLETTRNLQADGASSRLVRLKVAMRG